MQAEKGAKRNSASSSPNLLDSTKLTCARTLKHKHEETGTHKLERDSVRRGGGGEEGKSGASEQARTRHGDVGVGGNSSCLCTWQLNQTAQTKEGIGILLLSTGICASRELLGSEG